MRGNTATDPVLTRGLETLNDFIGIRLHFTEPSFIYKPETRLVKSTNSLVKRSDSRTFVEVGKLLSRDEVIERLVTLFKAKRSGWIGSIIEPEFEKLHRERVAVVSSLNHNFRRDMNNVRNWVSEKRLSLKDAFTSDYSEPMICSKVPGGIKDETLSLLNRVFGFLKVPSIDPLWETRRFSLDKYSHCIQVDKKTLLDQCDMLVEEARGN